jgi:hypothetical protein
MADLSFSMALLGIAGVVVWAVIIWDMWRHPNRQ